ncbi:ABC-2 type transport system ATP-binding protein [Streptosporangium becharense]|uniref:ABC-2 type transport system ATP-binding protein n=1 Tax=Streptosporangium becharense TaxID=1816182 RepID=A0A7W9IF92_9ACTN|nr:ABC transporter ATP-binding protein [Streptosporangium becharense]MBB2909470.1 ABC-2 type transport system ATP-binding protein [Streptosporangium becharense]MBB5819573.1 ABC-2 type transport system ATP-binding protein [Streptosporangium becharense]
MNIELAQVSRWYGNVVAVNDVTMTIRPGVTGLLGPNGAGKSTLLHMMAGFLPPSGGTVTLDGTPIWRNHQVYRSIGLVPEREAVYGFLTGWQFVLSSARLHRLPSPEDAARKALALVEMESAKDRRIETYSKGMRQRVKVAAALVHDPQVLLLDEPFNGMDPRQRLHLMDLVRAMGTAGKTILFSSHILEEVERVAQHIEVLVAGRHAASGDFREIRRRMSDRPHLFRVRSSDDRRLAAALIADASSGSVSLTANGLEVQAVDFRRFTWLLPRVAKDADVRVWQVSPADEDLESVFSYLINRSS